MPNCRQCGAPFAIAHRDLEFYRRISPTFGGRVFDIPPPTMCPDCRAQRRMVWRGELNLFRRKSDLSGKEIMTFYPPDAKCKVFNREEWFSDFWDPTSYGRDFDFTRPFFEQFGSLLNEVPLLALSTHSNENSDYVNCASWLKNCYLVSGANHDEDCYYGNYVNYCKNCVDNNFIRQCELCYECVDCTSCFNVRYSFNSHSCSDSWFLNNCRNCTNCFGCFNLVNKQYCIDNEQLIKTEYQTRLAEFNLRKRSSLDRLQEHYNSEREKFPSKYQMGEQNENVTGHGINSCRNTFHCFDVSDLEDCSYCTWLHKSKNCYDIFAWGFTAELCYECMEAGDGSYSALFCASSYNSQNVYYSYYPHASQQCFGCVGVRNKRFCVLNKQYSEGDYNSLVARIVEYMQHTGEWGEFFPISISPLAYNTSVAQDYFPLEKELCASMGWRWYEREQPLMPLARRFPPDDIAECDDSVVEQIYDCATTGKQFRITSQELKFYRENRLPPPIRAFPERHRRRLAQRNPRTLWQRECAKCHEELSTSYPPYRPDIVYCEKCYLSSIY